MGCCVVKSKQQEMLPEMSVLSIVRIQRWYRRYKARIKMRERVTWEIFQSIEYADEQEQSRLHGFFHALLQQMSDLNQPKAPTSNVEGARVHGLDNLIYETDQFRNYRGPHFKFPMDKTQLEKMLIFFSTAGVLHPKDVFNILRKAGSVLEKLPNINHVSISEPKHVTIVGDLHGHLDDLFMIFHRNNLPSPSNPYIFNGDYVDRGTMGIEVLIILLSHLLVYPESVFLNRGNHEDPLMNKRYGFMQELETKYGEAANNLMKALEDVYRWMPLATILNERAFIVHGGISDKSNMHRLKDLKRSNFTSILRPPGNIDVVEIFLAWQQIFDFLWSDPHEETGCIPNSVRGAGALFGWDTSRNFLFKNNLHFLIRSHECKLMGYEKCHFDKVITIFSASNYYAPGSNKGTFLKMDSLLRMEVCHFMVCRRAVMSKRMVEKITSVEAAANRELLVRLRQHRRRLEEEFSKHDDSKLGLITIDEWCECMELISKLNLPWKMLIERLAPKPEYYEGKHIEPGLVSFIATLQLLDEDDIVNEYRSKVCMTETLYTETRTLETIFEILDTDKSGFITIDELLEVKNMLENYLPSSQADDDLNKLMNFMDANRDGLVDFNEFTAAFRARRSQV